MYYNPTNPFVFLAVLVFSVYGAKWWIEMSSMMTFQDTYSYNHTYNSLLILYFLNQWSKNVKYFNIFSIFLFPFSVFGSSHFSGAVCLYPATSYNRLSGMGCFMKRPITLNHIIISYNNPTIQCCAQAEIGETFVSPMQRGDSSRCPLPVPPPQPSPTTSLARYP